MIAQKILKIDEGFSEKPYYCTEGYPTIGYGFKISEKNAPLPNVTITRAEADKKLDALICEAQTALATNSTTKSSYARCNEVRKATLVSMYHQLGLSGLLKFRKMWSAFDASNFEVAANECMDSMAAKQAPKRFGRNAYMLRTGQLHAYYG